MSHISLQDLDLAALERTAATLAAHTKGPATLCLYGDLGTGKTTFARAFIQSLVRKPIDVPSPTFTLIQTYETPAGPLWHADLYRLKCASEIAELGFDEAFGKVICLIEWPEILKNMLPVQRLDIHFNMGERNHRHLTLTPYGSHHASLLTSLKTA